jgi:DNA end-binding protein Ku
LLRPRNHRRRNRSKSFFRRSLAIRLIACQSIRKPKKAASGQKEMLLPIAGKKAAKEGTAKKPAAKPQRKSA